MNIINTVDCYKSIVEVAKQYLNLAPPYQATNLTHSREKGAIINNIYCSKNVHIVCLTKLLDN